MRRAILAAAALLLAAPLVRADIGPRPGQRPVPRPQPQPVQKIKVSIEVDEKATEPRLIVPLQAVMGGFNFGGGGGVLGVPPGGPGGVGLGGAQGAVGAGGFVGAQGGIPPGSGQPPGGPPRSQPPQKEPEEEQGSLPFSTLMIGLALTLSFTTGGLWAVRRKNLAPGGGLTPLVLVFALVSVAAIGAVAWANGAPPFRPQPRPIPQQQIPDPFPALQKLDGVRVDVVPQGDTVRLILTKKQKEAMQTPAKDK